MTFETGSSGNKRGRPKGSPNKLTKSVREAFEHVFSDLQLPGDDGKPKPEALAVWAEGNTTEFYKLCGKLIPQKIEHAGGIVIGSVATGVPGDETGDEDPAAGLV